MRKLSLGLFIGAALFTFTGCKSSVIQPLQNKTTTTPTAALGNPAYPATMSALKSSTAATLIATFTGAETTTLTAASGSTSSVPAGLDVSVTGTAACTQLDLLNPTVTGASITVAGCTGDGTVLITIDDSVLTSKDGFANDASETRTILVFNTLPTTSSMTVLNSVVGTTAAANVITATFNHRVKNLSADNSSAEFVFTGTCATPPSVSTAMSLVGGTSVATATLSGGTCADGETVIVTLDRSKVSDIAGNIGAVGGGASVNYSVDTTLPTATLSGVDYPGSQGSAKTADTSVLDVSFTNAASQVLVDGTYDTGGTVTGLTMVESGANCDLEIDNASTSGADLILTNCTGEGSITITVSASAATSAAGLTSAASATQTIYVQNTAPTVSPAAGVTPGPNGGNTVVFTFSTWVNALTSGGTTEFLVTGCAGTPPTIDTVVTQDVGSISRATVTLNDDGTGCSTGDTITITIDLSTVSTLSSIFGSGSVPETYVLP